MACIHVTVLSIPQIRRGGVKQRVTLRWKLEREINVPKDILLRKDELLQV